MESRIYTYTPRRTHAAPCRRRAKKRSCLAPLLRFISFCSLPVFTLFLLYPVLLAGGGRSPAGGSSRLPTEFAPPPMEEVTDVPLPPLPEEPESSPEYDYSMPVPASAPVDEHYFDDAVFIGDSRTEGFILYNGLSNTTSYAYKGLMVDTVFTKPVVNQSGQKVPVIDALKATPFSKVYIMLGVNETGWAYGRIFQEKYGELIDAIRAINPEATVYIQEILPVSNQVSSTHSYLTNTKISAYNALLRELAEEKQVYYIDAGSAVAAADGSLPEDASADGIHLVKASCGAWLDYLKAHTAA